MLLQDDSKADRQQSLFEDFKEFTTETTSHGIQYVFHAAYGWVRLIYLVLYLGAVSFTLAILYDSVTKYISMETGTKIEETVTPRPGHLNQSAISHPTINVCPFNLISKTYLDKNEGLEDLMAKLRSYDYNVTEHLFADSAYEKYKDYTYHELMWEGRPRIGLIQCAHYTNLCENIKPFNTAEFEAKKPHWDPSYNASAHNHYEWEVSLSGSCYRINPKGDLYTQVGEYGEITLHFFADLNDYSSFAKEDPMYGYVVTFTDNGTYSSTMTSGFFMSPGSVYKADLRKLRELNIGPPVGRCKPHENTNAYGTYSTNSCNKRCQDDYVMKQCDCVHLLPPHPENEPEVEFKSCTLEQWATCAFNATVDFTNQFVDLEDGIEHCRHCEPGCMEIWYEATISSSRLSKYYAGTRSKVLPGLIGKYNLNKDIPDGEEGVQNYVFTESTVYENVMVLKVLFTSIQESHYKEFVKYDFGQLIGDVGGQMGMLLGASLFTVIEFIHFGIKSCWRCGRRNRAANRGPNKDYTPQIDLDSVHGSHE